MPGIPLLLWGEEQAFYVLDNTANNYIFGRQAMSSATAWQTHGCYRQDLPSTTSSRSMLRCMAAMTIRSAWIIVTLPVLSGTSSRHVSYA
jgi:glycosidase